MRYIKKLGVAIALALGFSLLVPAAPSQASQFTFFHIVNKDTGKCLVWNGYDKKITQAKCKDTSSQWWSNKASKLCNYGSITGDWCLGDAGREKPVYGRSYRAAHPLFYSSLRPNAKTTIGALQCGYFKVVSGKVTCGKRILINHGRTYSPKMMWVIRY
ncbi:RICIN domain-containing protein [Streptomyces sp. NPDC001414]